MAIPPFLYNRGHRIGVSAAGIDYIPKTKTPEGKPEQPMNTRAESISSAAIALLQTACGVKAPMDTFRYVPPVSGRPENSISLNQLSGTVWKRLVADTITGRACWSGCVLTTSLCLG